jgi:hypothetical protein
MADLTISGNKKLKTISSEFQDKFPYLFLVFLNDEEQKKAAKSGGKVTVISFEKTLASVRTVTPEKLTDISVHGRTKVSTLERVFREEYGLNLQIAYAKNKSAYYTSGKLDDKTLTQLNNYLKENGYDIEPKI